jgi:hypothetical protein
MSAEPPQHIRRPVSRVLYGEGSRPHVTAIPLRRRLPGAFSNLPGRPDPDMDPGDCSACAGTAAAPSLFGLAPGGVCRAADVAVSAVRSYRTVSPLPAVAFAKAGGLFSVALSLGSRPPDVIRHRMSMEPGLSSRTHLSALARTAVRPTDDTGGRDFRAPGQSHSVFRRSGGGSPPKSALADLGAVQARSRVNPRSVKTRQAPNVSQAGLVVRFRSS